MSRVHANIAIDAGFEDGSSLGVGVFAAHEKERPGDRYGKGSGDRLASLAATVLTTIEGNDGAVGGFDRDRFEHG